MEVLFYALIAIGCIAAVIGELWFLVVAFRTSVVWGLVCIFVPFAALVFLFKYWHEVKLPFFTSLAGSVVAVIAVMGLAAYTTSSAVEDFAEVTFEEIDELSEPRPGEDWWEDQEVEGDPPTTAEPVEETFGEIPEEEEPFIMEDDPGYPTDTGVEPILEAAEADPEPTQPARRWRDWGVGVPINELEARIGQRVEIHTSDGRSHKAELEAVGPESIKVRQRMGAGYVSYTIKIDSIVEVRARD